MNPDSVGKRYICPNQTAYGGFGTSEASHDTDSGQGGTPSQRDFPRVREMARGMAFAG